MNIKFAWANMHSWKLPDKTVIANVFAFINIFLKSKYKTNLLCKSMTQKL